MNKEYLLHELNQAIKPGKQSTTINKWNDYSLDMGYWRARVYYEVSRDYLMHELADGGAKHVGDVAVARVLMVCFNHFRLKGDLPSHLQFPRTLLLSQQGKIEALHAFADQVEAL